MVRHPPVIIPPAVTLLDVMRWRADRRPDQVAYVFLRDGVTCDTVLTYGDLDAKARSIAGYLQSRFMPGERLLLVYPPGLDFVQAFWGALYAGLIAVPIPPPDAFRLKHSAARLQGIATDACSIGALSTNQIFSMLREQGSHGGLIPMEHWISLDDVGSNSSSRWKLTNPLPSALAYLQYTSGSTSAPKGVMVSHGNMVAQSRCITDAGYYDGHSVTLSWMPHFHDYGLVKGIIQPAWIGRPSYIMSPLTFLKRPLRWLEAIQRHHVTHSGGPNFAYRHCVEVVPPEDRARLDLSGWEVASCGAEPIAPDTIDRFVDAFAPVGFRREAFFPAYGMAEYTLLISLKREGVPPTVQALDSAALEQGVVCEAEPGALPIRQVIGCGTPVGDTKVVIAHPETLSRCAAQQVGEIWLAGASTTQGYWGNPEETARTFSAILRDTGEGPFLRTGDLGFVKNGEVFVTGRLKDLLIVRGRNHYPQDIERTVEQSHVLCRAGGTAAFSLQESGEEVVVVVQEVERQVAVCDIDEIAAAMRSAVSEQHDLRISSIIFIKAGSLPKTSSGKVQRRACREEFLRGRLDIIGKSVVQTPAQVAATTVITMAELRDLSPAAQRRRIEQWLQAIIADRLGSNQASVPCDRPVHLLGLDSLMAAEVLHRVEETFGIPLSLQILLGGATLGDLAVTIGQEFVLSPNQTHTNIPPDATEGKQGNLCLLSENQAALWFLTQLVPDSAAANVSMLLHLPSGIDETALRQALARLGERHAILRTTYETQHDIPVQRIHDSLPLSWTSRDASTWGWERVRREVMEVATLPFDLMRGPVWRASLFHREQDSFLLLVAHHIAVDGWSMALLVNDLKRHYASVQTQASNRSEGGDSAPVPYSDYVAWHRRLLEGEEGRRLSHYWKARLAGELPNYDMLYDRLHTTIEPSRYAWHSFHIDAALVERLKTFAHMEGRTLYTVCLAALQVVLYRYTDIEETTVASPVFGRSRSRFAQTVGDFVNILVLRDTLRADYTGRDLLAQTKRTVLEAFDHQDYPYARLVSDLRPARDLQRAPLAQILFVLQKFKLLNQLDARMNASAPSSVGERPREWDAYVIPQQSGQFDLCVELAESDQGLSGYFEYKEQLFAPDRVARMQEHFVRVLEGLVSDPAARIGELPLMSNAERQETVFAWSRSQKPGKSGQCLHRLIESQVQRTPDAIAVRQDGQVLTYRDLNERANRVAHYLRRRGVVPGVVVGLCLERSINLIVGMLGILKSGGAYLPLDIDYPTDRLEYMLRDSQVQVLVTQQDQLGRLPATNPHTICLDSEWETIAQFSDRVVEGTEAPDNLAYVIYTSGSTGHPKGVMIEHRSIANYVHAITDIVELTTRDRVLQFASLSFDTAAEEIFPCLTTGGMLVLRTSTMVDSVSG
ncbi:MAG: AMP-binding protein, partial [Nitrospirae bacterium]|nr:AMP-binding protein [Nitrospirota bacterium]